MGVDEALQVARRYAPHHHQTDQIRPLRDRAGSVDASGSAVDADAPLRARRRRSDLPVRLGSLRHRRPADDQTRALLGLSRSGHPLGLLHPAPAERRRMDAVRHLVVADRLRDVRGRPGLGALALLAVCQVPPQARAVEDAVRRVDDVASLRRPALRRDHLDLDLQRPAVDGAVQLVPRSSRSACGPRRRYGWAASGWIGCRSTACARRWRR